jgi:starch synthase
MGVQTLLAERRAALRGIVNGIDTAEWDPSSDPHIEAHFSLADMAGAARPGCAPRLRNFHRLIRS